MLRTNIELDERVLSDAFRLTGLKTKKALVNYALQELVRKRKRKRLLKLEGTVTWQGDLRRMRAHRT